MPTATLSVPAVECVSDGVQFAALRPSWGELSDASEAGIFTRWEWLYPWFRRIAPGRQLRILVARDSQKSPIGILPLALEHRALAGVEVRRLSFLGENHVGSDYLDAIARKGSEEQMAACFAVALRDAAHQWDLLDLRDLHSDSPLLGALQAQFADSEHEIILSDRFVCPFQTLDPGQPFDAFLRRVKRGTNYARRRKWLELQPGFEIERVDQPERLPRPLAEFFHLHRLRWAGDGGSQGIKGTAVEGFHRDATQFLAERGKVRFYTLRLQGRALSSVYGLVDRGKFIYFQAGYDPGWRDKSVGLVLVGETFRDSIESGLREYDFLRGQESYKSDWTTQQRRTVAIRIFNRRGIGRWFHRSEQWLGTARTISKKWLPQTTVERIRRARRARQTLA